jgi:hypothetical protein
VLKKNITNMKIRNYAAKKYMFLNQLGGGAKKKYEKGPFREGPGLKTRQTLC